MSRQSFRRPQSNTPQKGPRLPPPEPCNRLYVAFLPSQIQENELNKMFSECGNVVQMCLKKKDDGFTFAYITFQSTQQAEKGISQWNKKKMGEKSIMVKFANPIPMKDKGKGNFSGKKDFGGSNRGGFGFKKDSMNDKRFEKSSFNPRGKPFDRNGDRDSQRGGFKPRGGFNPNFKPRNEAFSRGRGGFGGGGRDKSDYQKKRNEDEKTQYGEDSKHSKIGQL